MQVNIIWMILCIVIVLGALIMALTYFLLKRNCLKNNLGMYLNAKKTKETGLMTLTIINVDKVPELWDVNRKELKLILLGNLSDKITFEKEPSIIGAYNAVHTEDFTTKDVVSFVGSIKYQKTFITPDNGKTKFKIRSIKVKSINAVEEKFKKQTAKKLEKLSSSNDAVLKMEDRMKNSDAEYYLNLDAVIDKELTGGMLCHNVESKSTQTSFRHQLYIPEGHPYKENFDPVNKPITFYFSYDGYMYELESNYVGSNGEIHKWDIINLEPGTIYTGFSFSDDGGKTILPSSAVYGITKNLDGELAIIDDSNLGHPNIGAVKHKMWERQTVTDMYGPKFTRVFFSLIAKKHHEADIEDMFITLHQAACETAEENGTWCLCKKYTWLKTPFIPKDNETFTKEEFDRAEEHMDRSSSEMKIEKRII